MDPDIDMDLLITLIKNRPVLWDKTSEIYRNRQLNFAAWKDICTILHEDFETLTDKEKAKFGKLVMKKWTNARDNWIRCAKKLQKHKSDSKHKPGQIYKFYYQMQFLNKIVTDQLSCEPTEVKNLTNEDVEENRSTVKNDAVSKKKKIKEVSEKNQLNRGIRSSVEPAEKQDNRIMSFFRGIAPTVEKFNDADIVDFQYEVIKAMRNITQRTQLQSSQVSQN